MKVAIQRFLARLGAPSLHDLLRDQGGPWRGGPTFILSFDVETRVDCAALPGAVRSLADRGLLASFACIGAWIDAYPSEHRALIDAGHELLNHTDTHPWHEELGERRRFDLLSDDDLAAQILRANEKIKALGARPLGFRAPHFGVQHTRRAYPLLRAAGLRYSSSTMSIRMPHGGVPTQIDGIWEFPLSACPRHPRSLLDSWHCTTAPDARHREGEDLVDLYREVLVLLERTGAFGCVYWDVRVLSAPGYMAVLDEIASAARRIRVARFADLLPLLENMASPSRIGAESQ